MNNVTPTVQVGCFAAPDPETCSARPVRATRLDDDGDWTDAVLSKMKIRLPAAQCFNFFYEVNSPEAGLKMGSLLIYSLCLAKTVVVGMAEKNERELGRRHRV
ncbi:hypothetical protein EVAR_39446_1 [Eumeta japonica]|uniref:Uncharacterized protein n=1 Tax=Eumeta variegata TaxID=151549 RepID=A0A4C1VZG7_EUMVA|nr:hypothetical protein EVAR_39446_1 [Eumeta japonica]